ACGPRTRPTIRPYEHGERFILGWPHSETRTYIRVRGRSGGRPCPPEGAFTTPVPPDGTGGDARSSRTSPPPTADPPVSGVRTFGGAWPVGDSRLSFRGWSTPCRSSTRAAACASR